jgi:hypothetical protein
VQRYEEFLKLPKDFTKEFKERGFFFFFEEGGRFVFEEGGGLRLE